MRYRIVKQGNKDYVGLEKPWWSFRWRVIKYYDGYGKKIKMWSTTLKEIKRLISTHALNNRDTWHTRIDIEYLDLEYQTIFVDF